MQSKFHIGQKVICVKKHSKIGRDYDEIYPEVSGIYTVRECTKRGGIKLVEIVNNPAMYTEGFDELSFGEERFVPIESIKVEWSELASKELSLN